MSIVHIAGPDIQVGAQLRQRCAWCGAVLLDYDLTRTAAPEGQDPRPGMWLAGELIEVDGGASWVRPHTDGEELPPNACARIDHEVTGAHHEPGAGCGMPTTFRKKPITVQAVQWTGDNLDEIKAFVGPAAMDDGETRPGFERIPTAERLARVYDVLHDTWVTVYAGQWVVKGVKGEFYPIAEDVLAETYEPVITTTEGGDR